MEEIVNIGSFELDTTKLEANMSRLQDAYFNLKKEGSGYTALLREQQKAANELTKAQLKLSASGEEESDAFKENEKALSDLNAAMIQNEKNQQNVANNMARVKTEINATNKQLQAYMDSEAKFTSLTNAATAALDRQVNNINDARASNTELLRVRNQLNPAIQEEAEVIQRLNQRLNENNAFIKENASEYEKQKINIGNYTESINEALGSLNPFNQSLGGFVRNAQEAGGAGTLIKNSFSALTTGIIGATKAGMAFIATPIGAAIAAIAATVAVVVGAFKFMSASMNSTEEGAQKLSKVTSAVTGVFNALWKIIKPLGEFIGGAFISAFEAAGEAVEGTVGLISDGLRLLGFEDAADGADNFSNAVKEGVKDAQNLAQAEFELAKANREAQRTQLEFQKQAEKLRQQRDDETKTIAERIAANEKLGAVLKQQMSAELAIAQQALKVADLRIKAEGANTEALNERAEALTRISDIQERITGQESEQLTNLNSLRREAAAQEKARQEEAKRLAQEAADRKIAAMQAELDFYLESQGIRKKDMAEQLQIDRETMRQSLAINKAEFDAKKKTRREFEAENLRIQNEFLQKQVEATVTNAEAEFEMLVLNNQRKIEQGQLLNDQLYQEEIDRINRLTEEAQALETLRYQQGLINLQQYQLAITQLDQADFEAKKAVELEREEAKKEKDAVDFANKQVIAEGNFFAEIELRRQQLKEQEAAEIAAAEKIGADTTIIRAKFAQANKNIDKEVANFKMDLAIDTFSNLATIVGKESKAGKALAIAQTTIETYKSATSAFSSLSGIPIVGPVLGGIAAAAAVASGLANVKKIISTKEPKVESNVQRPSYADGVIGLTGIGSGRSDNIAANLSAGESVITARSTAMFPNTLSAINGASGGSQLDGQLASAITQNNIEDRADNAQMATIIAEAVAIGAREGTAQGAERGMTNLSDNREIMANAKF